MAATRCPPPRTHEHLDPVDRQQRSNELHDKIDDVTENEAAIAADIVWLKWGCGD